MTTAEMSDLRRWKREATQHELQVALLERAVERGLAAVPIDEVCRAVGVSARTFFNHFSSKEEAAIGPRRLVVDEVARRRYLTGRGDPLDDLIALLADAMKPPDDLRIRDLIARLLRQEPDVLRPRQREGPSAYATIRRLVEERLRMADTPGDDGPDRRAGVMATIAITVARHGVGAWLCRTDGIGLHEQLVESLAMFRAVVLPASPLPTSEGDHGRGERPSSSP